MPSFTNPSTYNWHHLLLLSHPIIVYYPPPPIFHNFQMILVSRGRLNKITLIRSHFVILYVLLIVLIKCGILFNGKWDFIQWKVGSYSEKLEKIEQRGLIQSLIHVFLFICRALFTLSTWSYSVELMKNGILLIFFGILFNGFLA